MNCLVFLRAHHWDTMGQGTTLRRLHTCVHTIDHLCQWPGKARKRLRALYLAIAGELGGVLVRGTWSARECLCAVLVTVRRRWFDIVMLSSCALSEGVPGVRFLHL